MNEKDGFIVISKKLLKWEWYQDINTTRLFIHLLLIANWEDKKWQGIEIKRGQIVTSIGHLAENTNLSIQQVRTSLNKLNSTNEITKKTTNKYTVITINNYKKYQDYSKQNNNQITNKQQTNNNQITTTKPRKPYNQENNISSPSIVEFVEQNFGRLLSPLEYEEILSWEDSELTRYAIKQAVLSNKCSTKYISRILIAYQRENVKTVQQAQEREREYVETKKSKIRKTNEILPNWFDKDIQKKEVSEERKKEIEEILRDYK